MPHYVCPNSHVSCIVTFFYRLLPSGRGVSIRETPHGNVRAVRILLKCILVLNFFFFSKSDKMEKHKPRESWQEPVAKSEEAEENKNEDDTVTWDEFIQNTTIHGVRYIFDRSLRIRRFKKAVSDVVGEEAKRPSPLDLLKKPLHLKKITTVFHASWCALL